MKKQSYWILLAIFILAAGLRLAGMQTREIQYDDAFSIFLSQQSLPDIVSGTAADTMPPLYYFILHYWMLLFGDSLTALRLLSALFSLLALLVVFDLFRRIFTIKAGLLAAFVTAISPLQIYHAQDIRMYALLELTQVIYLWCFFSMFVKPNSNRTRISWWIGLILAGTASLYTHNLAIFGLVTANLFLLIERRWKDLLRLIAAQVGILTLALPWLVMLPGQIAKVQQAFWTPRPGLVEIFQAVLLFAVNLPLKGILLVVASILSVQILLIILIETIRELRSSSEVRFLATITFLLPGTLFAISYLMRPVFVTRGFLVSSLAYFGLAGWVISRSSRRGIGIVLGVTLMAAVAISLPSFYTFQEFPRSAFRETTTYLSEIVEPNDLILHDNKLSFFPSHYYNPSLRQEFLADTPGSSNDTYAPSSQAALKLFPQSSIQSAAGGYGTVYFVVFQKAIDEYIAAGENHPALDWLENEYNLVDIRHFSDLDVYEFSK